VGKQHVKKIKFVVKQQKKNADLYRIIKIVILTKIR